MCMPCWPLYQRTYKRSNGHAISENKFNYKQYRAAKETYTDAVNSTGTPNTHNILWLFFIESERNECNTIFSSIIYTEYNWTVFTNYQVSQGVGGRGGAIWDGERVVGNVPFISKSASVQQLERQATCKQWLLRSETRPRLTTLLLPHSKVKPEAVNAVVSSWRWARRRPKHVERHETSSDKLVKLLHLVG